MEQTKQENIKVIVYIFLALAFSIGIRMIWVYQFKDASSFFWNGQLMINTNDGYYFAEGARDYLAGFHQPNDLSPINNSASMLTAWIVKILPFSFESVILFMPAVLGSFIVIPMVLIGKSLKNIEFGFIAALLGSITWSYYNRTMTGYYDTDMLSIVFPMFILWALIKSIQTESIRYVVTLSLFEILYLWWYPQGYSLELAFFGLAFLYVLVFERGKDYVYKLLIIMLISITNIPLAIKLLVLVAFFVGFKTQINRKNLLILLSVATLLFIAMGGLDPIWYKLKGYVFREATMSSVNQSFSLKFYNVAQTIREAGSIPFEIFANRISGNEITFFVSIIGYLYLAFRHRVMLLALPMLGLGFLAYYGGLRFTVYAVPVMAFGVAYLIVTVANFVEIKPVRYAFLAFMTSAVLYPNIVHVKGYRVPTVFNSQEVKVADFLKQHAQREDYVISWWDYGYPLRYYSDLKTLVDGSKHHGDENFAPSYILTNPEQSAAKLARLEVEYTEAGYKDRNNSDANIVKMMKHYGYNEPDDFLTSLDTDMKLPEKTRDVYLYLPFRMMRIYSTVAKFSNMDLKTGKTKRRVFLYRASRLKDTGNKLLLGGGISVNKATNMVTVGKNKVPLRAIYTTNYNKKGNLITQKDMINPSGYLNLVITKPYNAAYLMDNHTFKSAYVQLFFFENYDKNLFELEKVSNAYAKLYKLKN